MKHFIRIPSLYRQYDLAIDPFSIQVADSIFVFAASFNMNYWLLAHFGDKDVAQFVKMSYDAFRHNFVAATGLSPLQFQLSERLRMAKNLVANTNLQMLDIAHLTGFASAAYFTRFFKSETKMPPSEYRKAQSTK